MQVKKKFRLLSNQIQRHFSVKLLQTHHLIFLILKNLQKLLTLTVCHLLSTIHSLHLLTADHSNLVLILLHTQQQSIWKVTLILLAVQLLTAVTLIGNRMTNSPDLHNLMKVITVLFIQRISARQVTLQRLLHSFFATMVQLLLHKTHTILI